MSIFPSDKVRISNSTTLSPSTGLQEWLNLFYTGMEVLKKSGYKPTPVNTREGILNLTRRFVLDSPEIAFVGVMIT